MSGLRAQRNPLGLLCMSAAYRSTALEAYEQGTMGAGLLRVIGKAESDSALEHGTAAHAVQYLIICACDDHRLLHGELATSTVVTFMARW
jgi:hypothetical protein